MPVCVPYPMMPNVLAFEHGIQVNEYGNMNEVRMRKGYWKLNSKAGRV